MPGGRARGNPVQFWFEIFHFIPRQKSILFGIWIYSYQCHSEKIVVRAEHSKPETLAFFEHSVWRLQESNWERIFCEGRKRESSLVNCLKLIIFQQHFCMSTMHLELPISDNTFYISTVTSAILIYFFLKKSISASTLIRKLCSISYQGVNSAETLHFSIFIQ